MEHIEHLRAAVSAADASLVNLNSDNAATQLDAILDFAALLTAAKNVVLNA